MAGLRTLSIISLAGHYARWRSYVKLEFKGQQSVEEALIQAVQKGPRCEARKDKDESGRMKTEISAFSFHNSSFLMR